VFGVLGALMILGGFLLVGYSYCNKLKMRQRILKEILEIIRQIISNIDFALIEMKEIFEKMDINKMSDYSKNFVLNLINELNKSDIDTFGEIWCKCIGNSYGNVLDKKTMNILCDVSLIDNYIDKNSQIYVLKKVENEVDKLTAEQQEGIKNKIKTYMVSSASIGIIVVIALI